jgi:hypothetical protein
MTDARAKCTRCDFDEIEATDFFAGFCHPRSIIAKRLIGGAGSRTLRAFGGDRCANA